MTKKHIAIIDDEISIQKTLSVALEAQGYTTTIYNSSSEALGKIKVDPPDLIILDIMMPGVDGITFCSIFRKMEYNIPIIFISSIVDEITKIEALERGGDDYLAKPFSIKELLVRVAVCLRRVDLYQTTSKRFKSNLSGFFIDDGAYQIFFNGSLINMSVTEFRIFKTLFESPNIVFSRDELMAQAYPEDTYISDRNVDTHITRIRKKIINIYSDFKGIESVYGLGYRYKK
ncbi:response regulator transcription factor [Thiospirochaeta perfilievii]|uniref:Response regulator transcription factor n=1 Tax=Thiospirochaeta perfilievii TaxID=252967 RepID=A0A5C1Q9U7_9SPIO|nr:response regulator transcription factor [Thiospirochaeta perfilievii]QEN03880.1 response regulator transcription factor [Thiospirochaeta perfilievii]